MKAFLAALGAFALALGISALVYGTLSTSASTHYATQNVRIDGVAAPEGWLAWATRGEDT
jgi:hypothetical protein